MLAIFRLGVMALMVLTPATAWATFWSHTRNQVIPVSDSVFEVISRPGTSAADYWCSAGDFAISQLRSSATQRLYIWRAIGPSESRPGVASVQFSYSAPDGANTSPGYSLSVKQAGDNLTAAAAQQYCFGLRLLDP